MNFVSTDNIWSVKSGWILKAANGQLVFEHIDMHFQVAFQKSHFISDFCKYRSGVLSSIEKCLGGAFNGKQDTVYITEDAEAVIDEIVTANRLLF